MDRRYADWLQAAEDSGAALAYHDCPHCEGQIAVQIPEAEVEFVHLASWCPHCDGLHFKTVWADGRVDIRKPRHDEEDS